MRINEAEIQEVVNRLKRRDQYGQLASTDAEIVAARLAERLIPELSDEDVDTIWEGVEPAPQLTAEETAGEVAKTLEREQKTIGIEGDTT